MTQTEALKLALEALENLINYDYNGNPDNEIDVAGVEAITTIKETLAVDKESLTTEARHMPSNDALYKAWNLIGADLAGLKFEDFAKNLLAQQSNEQGCEHCNHSLYCGTKCKNCGKQSNEQVEPAFWYRNEDIFGNQEMEPIFYATKAWVNCLPLYTHPPTPWTAKQIKEHAQQQRAQLPESPM